MKTLCAWCPADAKPMQDDGRDDGLLSHGICPLHMQYMRAKLAEYHAHADDARPHPAA